MFKAREAATAFRSGAVSVLAPAASPPQPLRRDARRRLRSGTEHEPPPPPLPGGLMGSPPCAGVHVIHRLNISVTCALFQNTYMLRFWNFAAPAALRRKNTGLQRQENQPIRRRRADPPVPPLAPPFILLTSDQSKESIKLPSGDRLKVLFRLPKPNGRYQTMAN